MSNINLICCICRKNILCAEDIYYHGNEYLCSSDECHEKYLEHQHTEEFKKLVKEVLSCNNGYQFLNSWSKNDNILTGLIGLVFRLTGKDYSLNKKNKEEIKNKIAKIITNNVFNKFFKTSYMIAEEIFDLFEKDGWRAPIMADEYCDCQECKEDRERSK